MAFYERIDKRKTIAKARIVLNEYSRFLKILNNALYDLDGTKNSVAAFSSYVNADSMLIEAIDRKDRNYEILQEYVNEIQRCINVLPLRHIEILNMRYVDDLTPEQIADRLSNHKHPVSVRQVRRRLSDSCLEFAIAYGVCIETHV